MLSKVVAAVSLTPELVAAVTDDLDPDRTVQAEYRKALYAAEKLAEAAMGQASVQLV